MAAEPLQQFAMTALAAAARMRQPSPPQQAIDLFRSIEHVQLLRCSNRVRDQ